MAVTRSVTVRNAELDSRATAWGASAKLRWYSGTMPANASTALSGNVLIAEFTLTPSAASGGVKAMVPSTLNATASAAGTVSFYRIYDSAGSTCHEQGTVSYTAAAWAISTAYALGDKKLANGNVYSCTTAGTSAGSGSGPSGTGSGITDGTAVWAYVSALGDLTIDNVVISSGQAVSQSTFALTAAA